MTKQSAAAALAAIIAGTAPAGPISATPAASVEFVKPTDLIALRSELERLRETVTRLQDASAGHSTLTELRGIKDEVESLRRDLTSIARLEQAQPVPDEIKNLKDEITALKTQIANHSTQSDIRGLKDELDALRKDVQGLNTLLRELLEGKVENGFTHDGLNKRFQRLDAALDNLAKKIETLEKSTRTAGASPLAKPADEAPGAPGGMVRIVNEYPIEISIAINGTAYRLEPNSRRDVPVPHGTFRYQLITSGGSETERSIREGETVTLTIR